MRKIWDMIKDWWLRGHHTDTDIWALTNTIEDKVKEALREAGVDPVTIEKVMGKL